MARIIVVGTGIAGLTTALRLAGTHEVTVVTKGRLGESNTALAQGGIAGVLTTDDTVDSHIADTLAAGAGLCDSEAVRVLCTEGPQRILGLAEAGVVFDRNRAEGAGSHSLAEAGADRRDAAGSHSLAEAGADRRDAAGWARGIEGAHSAPRIYHAGGDATGRAIVDALVARLLAEAAAGTVDLRTETMLVDLVVDNGAATGVSVLGCGGVPEVIPAEAVVLATGGAGQVFAHTTNPPGATGDGLAAAIRAGAAVRDLEFVQFHPTALVGSGFLVSEAVRGAGALLLDAHGRRFMPGIDPRAELAPRSVVALALRRTMAGQNGLPCHLDARAVPDVAARFPSIAATLSAQGLSLADDLIPVTPAAHYVMGGVATDLDGRTSLPGLFAVGEVACTGVHGANRLASNSLLEGAVFGARAAEAINAGAGSASARAADTLAADSADRRLPQAVGPRSAATPSHPAPALSHPAPLSRAELQALAWKHLGLERTEEGLTTLLDRLGESHGIGRAADGTGTDDRLGGGGHDPIETANLTLIARTMASAALARTASVGAHVRTDEDARRPATAGHPVLDRDHEEAASC